MDRLSTDLNSTDLSITDHWDGARTVVQVGGEIDIYTAPTLRRHLIGLLHDGDDDLVIDLNSVEFMDSSALGVLVTVRAQLMATDRRLDVICHQERIVKLFRVTGMDRVFSIKP